MKVKYIFIFLIGGLIFVSSCQKNLSKRFEGNYYFTTHIFTYEGNVNYDSVIYFYGSSKADSKTTLKIEYGPHIGSPTRHYYMEGTISPNVDEFGNLTYPDWRGQYRSFIGSFHDNGDIDITLSIHGLGGGWDNTIHGIKAN